MRRLTRSRFLGHIVVSVVAVAVAAVFTVESVPQAPPTTSVSSSGANPCQADVRIAKVSGGYQMTVCGFRFVYPRPWVIKTFYGDNDGVRTISSIFRDGKESVRAHLRCPMSVQPPGGTCTIHTRKLVRGAETFDADLIDCTQPEKASNGKPMKETRSVVIRIHAVYPVPGSPSCEIFPEVWEYSFTTALTNITNIYKTVGLE